MNDDAFDIVIATPEGLRDRMVLAYQHASALMRGGKRVHVRVEPALEAITQKQRTFWHNVVLAQISEQVKVQQFDAKGRPTGKTERYTIKVWKDYFVERLLGYTFPMRKGFVRDKKTGELRMARRATPHKELVSTESIGVRRYSKLIDDTIDLAIVEFSVEFVFESAAREEVRYVNRARQARHADASGGMERHGAE